MRKKIWALVILVALAIPCLGATFPDIPSGHWAEQYVNKLVTQYGVISGFPDGTYRGQNNLTRYEFAKVLVVGLQFLETNARVNLKEPAAQSLAFPDVKAGTWPYDYVTDLVKNYQTIKGYPDGTFKGNRTLTRYEICTAVSRALANIEKAGKFQIPLKTVPFSDLASDHWAYPHVQKLVSTEIILGFPDGTFKGDGQLTRHQLAVLFSKFMDYAMKKLGREFVPPPPPWEEPEITDLVDKALSLGRQASLTGSFGNVYEYNSATNNWQGGGVAAAYQDQIKLFNFELNYEIAGKYKYNRINYLIPIGILIGGGIVDEHRYEAELNTVFATENLLGNKAKFWLGIKYVNLNNSIAPTDFAGVKAGAATALKLFDRRFLTRGFYTYSLGTENPSPSVLGQPEHLFEYEISTPIEVLNYPLLIGYSGETMTYKGSGNSLRYYNYLFARYFLF